MPVNRHMMESMKKEYGEKKGKEVYYAMENKMKGTKTGEKMFGKSKGVTKWGVGKKK